MRFKGLEIREPKKSDSPKLYLDFINDIIEEDGFILINEKPTFNEEKKWLTDRIKNISNGSELCLSVFDLEKVVGNAQAIRDKWKDSGNVHLGIAISRNYRGIGLGEKLLRLLIVKTQLKFNPKNIYLRVFSDNKIAKNLYRKVGFRKIAHFPNWTKHKGKYVSHDYMVLKKFEEEK